MLMVLINTILNYVLEVKLIEKSLKSERGKNCVWSLIWRYRG